MANNCTFVYVANYFWLQQNYLIMFLIILCIEQISNCHNDNKKLYNKMVFIVLQQRALLIRELFRNSFFYLQVFCVKDGFLPMDFVP